jgi:small subunit ribosomal protein S17
MADEPDNETPAEGQNPELEATGDRPVDAPEAPSSPETEARDAGGPPEGEEVPQATPAAEAEEQAPESAEAPQAEAPEPVEQIPAKERRRRARSRHTGEPRPSRTPEERHAARLLQRRAKALQRRRRRLQERAKAAERRAAAPAPDQLAPVHAPVEGKRRVRQGIVVSDKAEKTITVRIDVARRHRRYEKIVRSSNTLHAHDENNDAHEGDVVRVIESRPLSRTKRWRLVDVVERAR